MALFKPLTSSDEADIKAWTNEVHHRIHIKAHQQSEFYSFDFYQEVSFQGAGKFAWEKVPNSDKSSLPNSLVRASLATWVTEEPSGNPFEEIPEILEDNVHFSVNQKG